jgi:hypothetical protein
MRAVLGRVAAALLPRRGLMNRTAMRGEPMKNPGEEQHFATQVQLEGGTQRSSTSDSRHTLRLTRDKKFDNGWVRFRGVDSNVTASGARRIFSWDRANLTTEPRLPYALTSVRRDTPRRTA